LLTRSTRAQTKFVGMMQYDGDLHLPAHYLIPPPAIAKTSGEWLSKNGLRTFACSETQKFGHVTFFWNGNRSVRARAVAQRRLGGIGCAAFAQN
jgi:bisphosphoglycerate-independent phosphoglycerate mutase (AlkP superfamily)